MIKINLASKKRGLNSAANKPMGESLRIDASQLSAIWAQLREFPLKKLGVIVLVAVGSNIFLSGYKDDLLKEEQSQYDRIVAEKPKLEAETLKMKGLQDLQKSMESDEKRIRTKLETIKKLINDRTGAAIVVEELAKITPANVWLNEFIMKGSELTFKGASEDFGNISDFTRMIQNSAIFSDMTLKDTQMTADDSKRQVASFSVTARKR
jgi:type IV pilus assembly protein PilN